MILKSVLANTALKFVTQSLPFLFARNNKSLIDVSAPTRVEPVVLVDSRLQSQPYMGDVMQSLTSLFAAYYMMAVSLRVNVGRVDVVRLLEPLNPKRAGLGTSADLQRASAYLMSSMESYRFGLPSPNLPVPGLESYGLEAGDYQDQRMKLDERRLALDTRRFNAEQQRQREQRAGEQDKEFQNRLRDQSRADAEARKQELEESRFADQRTRADRREKQDALRQAAEDERRQAEEDQRDYERSLPGAEFSNVDVLKDTANLSVGKMLEVSVTDNGQTARFPIQLRLIASLIAPRNLVHILGDLSKNMTIKERYHMWRAGQLEFVKDIVFCTDLIDNHRRTLAQDNTRTYRNILKTRNNNGLAAIFRGSPSLATASNMCVMSGDTVKELERDARGRLSDSRFRQRIFEGSYLMVLVVVDEKWESVTFYHRGIDLPTELNLRDIKGASKGGSSTTDIMEIFKALNSQNAPSF